MAQNILTSDLRKGNLIKTEYGILPVHAIVFQEVQVKDRDGRILWAKEIEGVELSEDLIKTFGFEFNEVVMALWKECWFKGHPSQRFDLYFKNHKILMSSRYQTFSESLETDIKFAHEIQNLYYWIERKELIIHE
ncbi:MAG: hypothetical protein LLF95_11240 [Bacteroidales bacterium]|nr:hypothetical protein [Bacteroidales bacterium]